MNFSVALPTFVITLREGVEAALVVGIVLALLNKSKQSQLNIWVYAGVVVGIIVSGLIGILFTGLIKFLGSVNPEYTSIVEPILEGIFSILAIIMLSWMLIWMTQQAKFLKSQVEVAVKQALTKNNNAGLGIFSLVLIAVVREGFETVLFIAANFQQGLLPTMGAIGGLATAAGIGVLLFKLGVRINIGRFFQVMGILLVLIVGGLLVSGLGHFDDAIASLALSSRASENLCFYYEHFTKIHSCILGPLVWNSSSILPDEKFPGIIFKSLFGYTDKLYLVQGMGYLLLLTTVGGLYFRSLNTRNNPPRKNTLTTQE
ncbi:FTR1 family iron permease [Cylindrospermopsis raciborskii]|jgi:high-affinity iron transporter|uniref:FTR1 family iron permease n=1 Tax=Cylindrospermopsis raciborskii TaxID=77022 RepID=UPI000E1F6C24|nr:FTR1 family protein [Cylindrospermopsis raciborskii]TPX28911.1 FTR1 family iron permease [Cylindrospermopsis raciborskii GIHE 2018]UJL34950.1 FTR1 family iron permease [Cylindrospermopsis raciborskii Cr2010]UJS04492.1 FTR1 family iron permease [Cylindrospermopsis raciborskii KLL07]